MNLCFTGNTTAKDGEPPYINYVRVLYDGNVLTIDRDATYYTVENNRISMDWAGLYIWDGDRANYDLPDGIADAPIVGISIEDDAPDGYGVYFDHIYFEQ